MNDLSAMQADRELAPGQHVNTPAWSGDTTRWRDRIAARCAPQPPSASSLPIIIRFKYALIIVTAFSPSKRFHPFDENFAAGWVWLALEPHHFINIVCQRHRVGVTRLMRSRQFRLHVGRRKRQDIHGRTAQLKGKRLQPGVEKRLGGAVGGGKGAKGTKARPYVVVMMVERRCRLRVGSSAVVNCSTLVILV